MISWARKTVKRLIAVILYILHRYKFLPNHIKVHTVDETLDILLNTEKSMVRFGDGEIVVIAGRSIPTQSGNSDISEGLKRILSYPYEDLIVTVPDIFGNLNIYVPSSKHFWQDHLMFFRHTYEKYCNINKIYYNTSVTRGYITYADKSHSADWFEKFRRVWEGKKVVVVEGAATHNGVGNDLLNLADSVERIICPSKNAFSVRKKIIKECLKFGKDRLFLLSVGVTAKFLTEELFLNGYRAIDIGNLDMEYEWFLQKAKVKVPLFKHSVVGIEANKKAGYKEYLDQIVCMVE